MTIELDRYSNRNPRKFKRLLWELAWMFLFRPAPRWCLNAWRRTLLRLFGAKIGKGVRIDPSARVWQPWKLSVGNNAWIGPRAEIYSVDSIAIGANAVVSESAFLCTASHDITSRTFDLKTRPLGVGDCAWICARAIVLPGADVGEGALVAAGSVVVKSVEPWTVVGGNPARFIKRRIVDETSQVS